MNGEYRVTTRTQVVIQQIELGVWGLYHLDTGEFLFVDELGKLLVDLIGRFDSIDEVIDEFERLSVEFSETMDVSQEVRDRLEKLERFGLIQMGKSARDCAPVLLVDPPCPESMVGTRGPGKGLCYLSDALRRNGLPGAQILDLRSVSPEIGQTPANWAGYFCKYASTLDPAVIGITAVSATITNAILIGKLAKTLFPSSFVVLGGAHASYEWEQLLNDNEWLDAVVIGEGELPFPQLVERILKNGTSCTNLSDIKGIAWRNQDGVATSTGWCRGPEDIDLLGFPDDRDGLLNAADYKIRYARIMSSRGCPFTCSFCSTATFTGRRVRYRSSESIIAEITHYWSRYQIEGFSFDDDIFTVNRKRTLALCEALGSATFSGQLHWGCNTRMDCIDEELIDSMHEAGCRMILFGIESGSEDVQDRFGKGRRSLEHFHDKIRYMIERGIEPQLNFILGLPGEDDESTDLIWELIKDFPTVTCSFNFLNVFPGTPLAAQSKELGIRFLGTRDTDRYSVTAPTLTTHTMNADDQIGAFLRLQWRRAINEEGVSEPSEWTPGSAAVEGSGRHPVDKAVPA